MGEFINLLKVIPYGDGINWCISEDFKYLHDDGNIIIAPERLISDFASIPREVWSILGPPWGKYGFGGVTHDGLYYTQLYSRDYSDEVLMSCMKCTGVSVIMRDIIYEAVHKYGQASWDENKRKKDLGFTRIAPELPKSVHELPYTWIGTTGDWQKG